MADKPAFKVAHTPRVKRQVREVLERLAPTERLVFADLWDGIEAELRRDPETFGEPRYATRREGGTVYHRLKDDISVEFAVYPQDRAVIVINLLVISKSS